MCSSQTGKLFRVDVKQTLPDLRGSLVTVECLLFLIVQSQEPWRYVIFMYWKVLRAKVEVTRPGGKNGDLQKGLNKISYFFCWIIGGIRLEIPNHRKRYMHQGTTRQIKENS